MGKKPLKMDTSPEDRVSRKSFLQDLQQGRVLVNSFPASLFADEYTA